MEAAILICCAFNVLLLLLLLYRTGRGDDIRMYRELRDDMDRLRRETGESLEKINGVVTEKLEDILDRRLMQISDSVVRNMAGLGSDLRGSQDRQREALRRELEALRRENTEHLERINAAVNDRLQRTLNERISQSFKEVHILLESVNRGLGEMKAVSAGVDNLNRVLTNVKRAGNLGEIQLYAILEDILAPQQYETQVSVKPNSALRVDAAVRLPGQAEGETVYLPIDSKFLAEPYRALTEALDAGDPKLLRQAREALAQELKKCARDIHDKYIAPPYTTDFAIMFLPSEGLYAEAVRLPGMMEEMQKLKINISGPSTTAALLNSLRMGFRTLAIQKKSGEVWKILEDVKKQFTSFETGLNRMQDNLEKASRELDELVGARTRAINRSLRDVSLPYAADTAAGEGGLPGGSAPAERGAE